MTPSIVDLRKMVEARKKISLIELANEFRTNKAMIEPMMERLVSKGQVDTWVSGGEHSPCCGGSCGCGGTHGPIRFYRWVG